MLGKHGVVGVGRPRGLERRAFGHENLGRVIEVGQAVEKIKVGDWVCLPFNVACGHCVNCERGLTNYCLTAQPAENMASAAYGFAAGVAVAIHGASSGGS